MATSSNFIDYVKFYARSGKGGAGSANLRREKFVPKGGPDGGDGGRGGHIILRGNNQYWTLLHLKYNKNIIAPAGEPGGGGRKHGARGNDIFLDVPLGTVIKNAESGEVIGEIVEHGETKIILHGGKGGLGNDHFKSSTNQTPRYAQPGEPAEEAWFILELKVLADVGLVGFPNAGKSTLLSVLSAAKPEVADYPFTTLTPNLGVVPYRDYRSFVMADIPGIIEGASTGKGLGTRFLKHIERNGVLMFVVPADSQDINKEYETLIRELSQYNPDLLKKKRILTISKSDLLDEELEQAIVEDLDIDIPYIFVSAVSEKNLTPLKDLLWEKINENQEGY